MNKRNKVVAVITSILLAASMASLSIPAQAEQNTITSEFLRTFGFVLR